VCSAREAGPEQSTAEDVRATIESELAADGQGSTASGAGEWQGRGATVLGPAPLFRLKGRERAQVVVKAADRAAAIVAVRRSVERVADDRRHRSVAFSVDVDPQ
jgi:primosomal protein N' (replication factor Y)